jgi:hypothetical protein
MMGKRWTIADVERITGQKLSAGRTDAPTSRRKYRNVPTQGVNGLWFDSKQEAQRAQELWLLEKAGIITELELDKRQLRYDLLVNGVKIGVYEADSRYRLNGVLIVEDVKSKPTKTRQYQRTKRHLKAQYGIEITEYLV